MHEGADRPDCDAKFGHISAKVKRALGDGDADDIGGHPKERTGGGLYLNGGQHWLPVKKPIKVNGHNFPSPDVPRAYPYGINDPGGAIRAS